MPLLPPDAKQHHLWPADNLSFCPDCLQKSRTYRLRWAAVSVCLRHQCVLMQGCPACRAALSVTDILGRFCPICQADVWVQSGPDLTGDVLGLTTLRPEQPGPTWYQIVHALQNVIRHINQRWDWIHNPLAMPDASLFGPLPDPLQMYHQVATACQAIMAWPSSFETFLTGYKLRDQREPTDTLTDLAELAELRTEPRWQHYDFMFFWRPWRRIFKNTMPIVLLIDRIL